MRILTFSLVLALGGFAWAEDCQESKDCDTQCSTDCCDKLTDAQKSLSAARAEERGLTKFERKALDDARQTVLAAPQGKALAPTFAANAKLLRAAAAVDALAAGKATKTSKLMSAMADNYAALAAELGAKVEAGAAPADIESAKKAVEAAKADYVAAKKAWKQSKDAQGKLDAETRAQTAKSLALLKDGSPSFRALALNVDALNKSFDALKQEGALEAAADGGDARAMCVKGAHGLHTMAAPMFDGVQFTKPEAAPAAPS